MNDDITLPREVVQEVLEALEYHVEQTRPIHRTSEAIVALRAVITLALKDLEAASDEDIRAEFAAEGTDPDQLAGSIAQSLDEVLAANLREQAALRREDQ